MAPQVAGEIGTSSLGVEWRKRNAENPLCRLHARKGRKDILVNKSLYLQRQLDFIND